MKRKLNVSFNTVLVEVVSIIIAVVMGFIVNEWRENLNHKSNAKEALRRIAIEIEQNRLQANKKQKYYKSMISAIDSVIAEHGTADFNIKLIKGFKGINPPLLTSSAYKTASTIGVFNHIDFDTADNISKVYLLQDKLQEFASIPINSMISGELFNYQSFKLVYIIFNEYISGLVVSYENILAKNLKDYVNMN